MKSANAGARQPAPVRPQAARSVATPPPAPALTAAVEPTTGSRWLSFDTIGFAITAVLIVAGYLLPTQRYISPRQGLGYALGIIGGSAMLLSLLYPARKHLTWLGFIGSVKGWFQVHMFFGVFGPLLILYHSNFSLGATNSNAALFAMLVVSGSGIFGRYFYTRIHCGLYGRQTTRTDMQAAANELRTKVSGSQFVPELLVKLDAAEARLLARKSGALRLMIWPLVVTCRMYFERWALTRIASRELRNAAERSPVLAKQHAHFARAVQRYIAKRLQATRELAEFESYERLFSLWHMFHLPLFFLLLIAGTVHVIAVHVY